MLSRSPSLVRWGQILAALQWLKANNPLYTNVQISEETLLADYPEFGSAPGFAVQELLGTNAVSSEGTSYTSYTDHANAETFQGTNSSVPISSCGILDTDQVDTTYKM